MRAFFFLQIAILAMLLTGCGNKSKTIAVRGIEIYGYLDDDEADEYFKIEDGNYKFYLSNGKLGVDVTLNTLKRFPSSDIEKAHEFYINVHDADGYEIKDQNGNDIDMWPDDVNAITTLATSVPGDKTKIRFQYALLDENDILERINDFDLCVDIELKRGSNSKTGNKTSNSSDWDEVLDEYEKYVDSYVKLIKKVNDGDLSAMSEYATMLEKIGAFGEKLNEAEGSMTSAQSGRYIRISAKMVDAL